MDVLLTVRSVHEGIKAYLNVCAVTRHFTAGIRSERGVVRRFRRCANVYLHKPRQYSITYYTPTLYGIAYCS